MRPILLRPGDRFGKLTVLKEVAKDGQRRLVQCRCDCGKTTHVKVGQLRRGTRSCGCVRNALSATRAQRLFRRHGEASRTVEYAAWQSMLRRCQSTSHKRAIYFDRGITVCAHWRSSYENFLADVGRRPVGRYSLDRIDTNGNYEPGNVRWADIYTQNRNRRPVQRRRSNGEFAASTAR